MDAEIAKLLPLARADIQSLRERLEAQGFGGLDFVGFLKSVSADSVG